MTRRTTTIRHMTTADIPIVTEMERLIFSDPWPVSAFREAVADPRALNLIAVADDTTDIRGYLMAQTVADEIHVHNIAVAPSRRRHGLGRRLLSHAECHGRKQGATCCILEVRINNTPALAMYSRLGYRRIGRRRGYYRQPICDALVLLKILDGEDTESLVKSGSTDGMVS